MNLLTSERKTLCTPDVTLFVSDATWLSWEGFPIPKTFCKS